MRAAATFLASLMLSSTTASSPALDLAAAVAAFGPGADFPLPPLDGDAVKRLAEGEIVKIREVRGEDEPQRAVGLVVAAVPRDRLWLSALDPHFSAADEIIETRLTADGEWPNQWYQYLDLPRPFSDRHWVIDVWNNTGLAGRTGAWEHAWDLHRDGPALALRATADGRVPGVDAQRAASAIYTPVNHGAWIAAELPDGRTLLGYHVTTIIGGAIPDRLVADYAMATLGRVLRRVIERAPDVSKHYGAGHAPILGGDGRPIGPHP